MKIPMTLRNAVVILANGEFPEHAAAREALLTAKRIICCDGAIRHLHKLGIKPDVIVGDCDSIPPELKSAYADKLIRVPEQETNDLSKAVALCPETEPVVILGGNGLREDHAFANMALLAEFSSGRNAVMISDYGTSCGIGETTEFESFTGQPVSVFSFTPETLYTYRGLKYGAECRAFPNLWCASLNVSSGDSFTVRLDTPGRAVVFRGHK